jgi:hypothetical protein
VKYYTLNFLFHVRREKRGRAVVACFVESFSYCVVHRRLIMPKCGRVFSCQNAEESYHRRLIVPKCRRLLSSLPYHAKMRKSLKNV